MSAPTRTQALSLLRSLLRSAAAFPDYNVRAYAARRACEAFRGAAGAEGDVAARAYARGAAQLEVLRRQAVVYGAYGSQYRHGLEAAAEAPQGAAGN